MTKLITYAYMRDQTDVSQNVDNQSLDNPIKRAQDMLKFLLGTAFYEEIETQFVASTLTAANEALFDPYIKKYIAWQAYELYAERANIYESRTGFRIFQEENSEIAPDSAMGSILKRTRQWTQFYKGEMLTFLKQQQRIDSSAYPLYKDCANTKQGNGFQITAITAKDKTSKRIDDQIRYNG